MATEVQRSGQTGSSIPARRDRSPFLSLRDEMDRMFNDFLSDFSLSPFQGWRSIFDRMDVKVPAIDVVENEKSYRITAELPGMDEKDIEVSVTDQMLTIRGEKKEEREEESEARRLSERSYGSFERSLRLPPGVETDKIDAEFKKGVLTINLPKSEEAQKRQRKIQVKGQ